MKPLEQLLRPNILILKPYSSARDEYSGDAAVFLDANENPFNSPYNRYPDPYQRELKAKIGDQKNINPSSIFLGNGSDEPIDLLYRAFCEPAKNNVVSIDPTYGMYQVAADINNIEMRRVLLTEEFELDVDAILASIDNESKLLFLCSPNNPTGNCFNLTDIELLIRKFEGIVVLDEAYIDFAPNKSFLPRLDEFPNLVILQTFSKAWGMAGLRLGLAFASEPIIKVLSKIKYPYNLNILTQKKALELIESEYQKNQWVKTIIEEKELVIKALAKNSIIQKIYPSDANFVLVKTSNPKAVYSYLSDNKVIIRDRSSISLCKGCLRITIGSSDENIELLKNLKRYEQSIIN